MKKKKLMMLVMSTVITATTLLAGCGAKSTTTSTDNSKDKDYIVKLGYYNCDHMTAACIAKDAGIFDKLGVKVEVTGNGKVPEAMAAGKSYAPVDMSGLKDKYLAFKTGKIDGYTTCDPWGSMAEYEKTGKIMATYTKVNGDWGSCCVYAMNTNFAKEHPELAKKMILAHTQAMEYIYTHPIKSAKIFATNYKVPEEVALMTIYKKTVGEGRTLTWEINADNVKHEIEAQKKVGAIKEEPKMDALIQDKLLKESGSDDFNKFIKEKVAPVFPEGMTYEQWKQKAMEVDK